MNQKESEKKQRELLRAFDQELFTYTGQIAWFIPGILSFILLILLAIPLQEFQNDDSTVILYICLFIILIPYFVLLPYTDTIDTLTPHQKRNKTYNKLKYLPVSKKQYKRVRMEYLFRFFWKFAIAGLAVQCIFALAVTKSFSLWNVLYIAAVSFVLPLISGWLMLIDC